MLRRVTNYEEESPYKPETTLLCVRSRSKNVIALIIAPKEWASSAINYLMTWAREVQENNSRNNKSDRRDPRNRDWILEENHS